MSRYFFFENSYCTHLGALIANEGEVWLDRTNRRLWRPWRCFPATAAGHSPQKPPGPMRWSPSLHEVARVLALESLRPQEVRRTASRAP